MSDGPAEVKRLPLPVGAMAVTYQITIGDGRTMAFETAVDATVAREDLDGLLDTMGGAAERRQAIFELPLVKANLFANRELLADQEKGRANAIANLQAHVEIRSRGSRPQAQPVPSDVNAVAQFDDRIAKIKAQIKTAELRIPYLEALIDRRDPPDLFPELADRREAAE
jgi:hypothetical protein